MQWLRAKLHSALVSFREDSLFRNAVYLMASTGIMSVLGFGFWLFVAHLYSAAEIGEASALIAITLLLSNLSFFGLNAGIVRFLPTSKTPSRDINAALITVSAATMTAAAVYFIWHGSFRGDLLFFSAHWWSAGIFIVLLAAVSLNTLTDSVFIANRRTQYHTIVYTVFGVVKLILPLFLIPYGSLGVFLAYSAAALVSLFLSFVFMWRACGYRFLSRPNWQFIKRTRKYTRNNYVGTLLSGLPAQIMPSLIIGRLGGAEAAYFSMAWTMANLLYVVPSAITNSLLAESSHDVSQEQRNVRHASKILALFLVPIVVLAIVVAPYLLRLFGHQYSVGGTAIFQIMALTTFSIAANSVGNTIMNIEQRTRGVVLVQLVIALSILGLVLPLMRFGLVGVGLAMLGGNIAGNITQLILLHWRRRVVAVESVDEVMPEPSGDFLTR